MTQEVTQEAPAQEKMAYELLEVLERDFYSFDDRPREIQKIVLEAAQALVERLRIRSLSPIDANNELAYASGRVPMDTKALLNFVRYAVTDELGLSAATAFMTNPKIQFTLAGLSPKDLECLLGRFEKSAATLTDYQITFARAVAAQLGRSLPPVFKSRLDAIQAEDDRRYRAQLEADRKRIYGQR